MTGYVCACGMYDEMWIKGWGLKFGDGEISHVQKVRYNNKYKCCDMSSPGRVGVEGRVYGCKCTSRRVPELAWKKNWRRSRRRRRQSLKHCGVTKQRRNLKQSFNQTGRIPGTYNEEVDRRIC